MTAVVPGTTSTSTAESFRGDTGRSHDTDAAAGSGAPPLTGAEVGRAAGAGFGAASAFMCASFFAGGFGLLVAPVMGAAVGRMFAGRRWVALGGMLCGVVAWSTATGGLVAARPGEWSGLEAFFAAMAIVLAFVLSGIALLAGGIRVGPRRPDTPTAHSFGYAGLAATAACVATLAVLVWAPASRSFEVPLPSGWWVLPRDHVGYVEAATFGEEFTAVFGRAGSSPSSARPVIEVSVTRGGGGGLEAQPDDCYRAFDTWAGPNRAIDNGSIESVDEVSLPVGSAHLEVRRDASEGLVYGYGIARSRLVGVLPESLCYLLTITVPPGSTLDASAVNELAGTFRFR